MNYGRYVFSCVFEDDAFLPPYKGSTIRGIFGLALKKVVCALKKQECADCLLAPRCIYPTVFELPVRQGQPAGTKRVVRPPHPYVIEPPDDKKTHYSRGDSLNFTLLLFGAANDNIAYFIYAFDQMGDIGIGKSINSKRASFLLMKVSANEHIIYKKSEGKIQQKPVLEDLRLEEITTSDNSADIDVEIELITPLRLKYQNSLNAELPFHVLTRAMLRRVSSLFEYHGGGEPSLDYMGLIRRAKQIEIKESHIKWYDWRRYSNRQEQAMMMGGMIGRITYRGQIAEYITLLRVCEKLHIGKQTSFGLGKIIVHMI